MLVDVGWLGFMAYQPLSIILRQNHFYANSRLYFKQFSLAWVHSLIVKTVLIQTIQFSISTDFVYPQLNVKTVLYQTIQFSISTQFECKYSLIVKNISTQAIQFSQTVLIQTIQFSISMLLVLFNAFIGPSQGLPFRARVELGAMAMKGYSAFPKAPASLEPHHQIV